MAEGKEIITKVIKCCDITYKHNRSEIDFMRRCIAENLNKLLKKHNLIQIGNYVIEKESGRKIIVYSIFNRDKNNRQISVKFCGVYNKKDLFCNCKAIAKTFSNYAVHIEKNKKIMMERKRGK